MKSPSPNRCDYSTVLAIQSLSELLLLLKRRIESTRPATYQFSLLLTAWRRRNCHRPLWRRQGAEAPLLAEGSGHSVSAAALVVRFSDGGSLHHCRSWSSPTSAVSSSRAGAEASRTPRVGSFCTATSASGRSWKHDMQASGLASHKCQLAHLMPMALPSLAPWSCTTGERKQREDCDSDMWTHL